MTLPGQSQAYKDSKVCDVMLMKELHRRFHKETGIGTLGTCWDSWWSLVTDVPSGYVNSLLLKPWPLK